MNRILLINGSNLNMLGIREPEIYGSKTLAEIEKQLVITANDIDIDLKCFQSNHEGEIIDFILDNYNKIEAIIINPAAFSKTSYGILEAISSINTPFVEVHISNIYKRGGWHAQSIFSEYSIGVISGFGHYSYELALHAISQYINQKDKL